jgi:hypothetical protein
VKNAAAGFQHSRAPSKQVSIFLPENYFARARSSWYGFPDSLPEFCWLEIKIMNTRQAVKVFAHSHPGLKG